MLHILLTILKVLGITLLVVLGILLTLVLLVLFVPIRYNINAGKEESVYAKVSVSWLLHLLHVRLSYSQGMDIAVRIFGIKVFPRKSKKPKKQKKSNKDKQENTDEELLLEYQEPVKNIEEQSDIIKPEKSKELIESTEDTPTFDKEDSPKPKKSLKERLSNIKQKILDIKQKVKNTIASIKKFFVNLGSKLKFYFEMLLDEANKNTIKYIWKCLKDLIKHILPRRHSIVIKYGNEDPAKLADIIGYVACFKSATNINLKFTPVFNEDCMEGSIILKGRLRLAYVLLIAIRVYKNKDIRKFLNNFTQ